MNPMAPVVSKERIARLVEGSSKPKNEAEGMAAMSAMMWKKSFDAALSSIGGEEDALSAPESKAIKDRQSTWMGIEAAAALNASMAAQLSHAQSAKAADPSKK
jgi:hypothetical protein